MQGAGLLSSDLDFSPPSHLDFSYTPIWISLHHLPAPITWDKKHLTMSSLRELKSYIRRSFASYLGEEQLLRTIWVIAWSTTSHSWPWVGLIFHWVKWVNTFGSALLPCKNYSPGSLWKQICETLCYVYCVLSLNLQPRMYPTPCQRSIYNWESFGENTREVRNSGGGGSKMCAATFWVGGAPL